MMPANDANVIYLAERMKDAAPVECLRAYLHFTEVMIQHFEDCAEQSADLPTLPDHIALSRLFQDTAIRARECAEIWRAQRAHADWILTKYTRQPDPAA